MNYEEQALKAAIEWSVDHEVIGNVEIANADTPEGRINRWVNIERAIESFGFVVEDSVRNGEALEFWGHDKHNSPWRLLVH